MVSMAFVKDFVGLLMCVDPFRPSSEGALMALSRVRLFLGAAEVRLEFGMDVTVMMTSCYRSPGSYPVWPSIYVSGIPELLRRND